MKRSLKHPVFWGVCATALLGAFAIWIGSQEYCVGDTNCRSKLSVFLDASPNEVGDTLAGFAGTLAFVWIIVTVWLQSLELAEQRKELAATREELKLSREAQQQQVKALRSQAEIFLDEQRSRQELRAGKLLEERLKGLAERIVGKPDLVVDVDVIRPNSKVQKSGVGIGIDLDENMPVDVVLRRLNQELEAMTRAVEKNKSEGTKYTNHRYDIARFGEIEGLLEAIIEDFKSLSEADKQRVRNLHIVKSYTQFLELLDLSMVEA